LIKQLYKHVFISDRKISIPPLGLSALITFNTVAVQ